MADYKKFIFLTDSHYGWERKSGHKIAIHDERAIAVALDFARDFKPDTVILGGDILDASCLSHHNKHKPGRTEGLRLQQDSQECRSNIITPVENLKASKYVYINGNHEAWLQDFEEDYPAVEGMFNVQSLLSLDSRWEVIALGGHFNLGKLSFIHGDQISGSEQAAKNAVIAYERSVRFGHFHSHQTYSKNTPITSDYPKTGISVGCLCRKDLNYGNGRPNKWSQGFLYGYILPDGSYHDYVVTIVKGKAVINGKIYST
jgi:hypothetical protein